MRRDPVAELAEAVRFYATLGIDVSYFAALWHTFNVGHMLNTDLNRVCRAHGFSIADFNLLGALRIDRPQALRATDLAHTLQVSQGALTARVTRLTREGLIEKAAATDDRRAFCLSLSSEGRSRVDHVYVSLATESQFVRQVRRLPADDRAALARIMGRLHVELDRTVA